MKPAFRPSDPRLAAPAGLVAGIVHPNIWWTIASPGGRPMLFAVDPKGRTRAAYSLTGVAGARVDAITIVKNGAGESGLFLGDLSRGRTGAFYLYRVAEPKTLSDAPLAVKPFKVRYPNGGGNEASALLADPAESRLYVITRNKKAAAVFALPGVLGPGWNALTRLRTLPFPVRGGQFTPDGRVVLKTTEDVRILGGIQEMAGQVVRTATGLAGDAFGVTSTGRRALVVSPGVRPTFQSVALPAPNEATKPTTAATEEVSERTTPVAYPSESGLPGGPLGTGALAGLVLLGAFGVVFYLRGRRSG
ncbi:hypothetical protein D0T12_14130 [Actinomadura spongiicola]|uniref:Esterase-like activity of phytase family protein n=1 Tax=Actinomadura spongiicola TaxID=2303421 RepID=A0A372GH20_9ACTN|nr:hypothetical protein D0T12_14130 [Actinomadura spongiicola]